VAHIWRSEKTTTTQTKSSFDFLTGVFEYGDFRDEESGDKYEGFLVVASSKGDTLSLFEPKG
jgi:hypothetical protein